MSRTSTSPRRIVLTGDAGACPSADERAERAVPYLLKLGVRDNGKPRTVP
jgi:hypothetical protein